MSDTPPIVDAETVAPEVTVSIDPVTIPAPSPGAPTFDINAYNATIEMVRRRLTIMEKAKEEIKKLKEMFDDALANDPLYAEADKVVKDLTNKRKEIAAQISKQPAIASTMSRLKDLKEEIKSNEVTLADELMEYYKTAGVMEIEDANGQVQEFVISIKLKPKVKVG